jgi:hypothetical protein
MRWVAAKFSSALREFLDGYRRAPQPEARRDRREIRRHKGVGLQPLDRRRQPAQRESGIAQAIDGQAPDHAVHQRRQIQAEQMLRPQHVQAKGAVDQDALTDKTDIGERRQQQRIGPHGNAGAHAGDGAGGGAAPPVQAAEKRRRQLRDRGEGQNADGEKLRLAGRTVIHVGHQQNGEDRQPPHRQQQGADIVAAADQGFAPLQHQRHDQVVRHHDRQRHRFHDHHGGRRRQAADEGDNGEDVGAGLQRQRQHEHVAIDRAGREGQQAGDRDRHHEQIDQHQVDRKQPGGAPDFIFVVVLDHGDMKLARQQDDGHE